MDCRINGLSISPHLLLPTHERVDADAAVERRSGHDGGVARAEGDVEAPLGRGRQLAEHLKQRKNALLFKLVNQGNFVTSPPATVELGFQQRILLSLPHESRRSES